MERNGIFRLIIWLYDRLAGLYPAGYRRQFFAEQREVFLQALEDAALAGSLAGLRLLAREFADLPGVLARRYLAAFQKGGWETVFGVVALLALFTLPSADAIDGMAYDLQMVVGIFWQAVLLSTLFAALLLGFPRWTLPCLGFFLSGLSFLFTISLIDRVMRQGLYLSFSNPPLLPRLLFDQFVFAFCLIGLVLTTFLVFFILRLVDPRRLPRLWRHPRRWSDASFLLYGGSTFLAMAIMDEYVLHAPVTIPAGAALFLGAYGYLRAANPWRGVRALIAGAALAFIIIGVGKYWLVPLQVPYWHGWFDTHAVDAERWFEAISAVLIPAWLIPLLLLPAAWRPFIERPSVS